MIEEVIDGWNVVVMGKSIQMTRYKLHISCCRIAIYFVIFYLLSTYSVFIEKLTPNNFYRYQRRAEAKGVKLLCVCILGNL